VSVFWTVVQLLLGFLVGFLVAKYAAGRRKSGRPPEAIKLDIKRIGQPFRINGRNFSLTSVLTEIRPFGPNQVTLTLEEDL
jgi:hypothetical protein